MIPHRITLFFLFMALLSCADTSKESSIPNGHKGLLHANSCMSGASYLVYEKRQYGLGSKSVPKLNRAIAAIREGQHQEGSPVESSGCVSVYEIEFAGEFEKESALTGYNNDEIKQVVQVYQFRFL